jgi:hypothetical protein
MIRNNEIDMIKSTNTHSGAFTAYTTYTMKITLC